MDWPVLLLLVPAILVPVVILFGFAGCDRVVGVSPIGLTAPAILSTEATGLTSIRIVWNDPNFGSTTSELSRTKEGDSSSTTIPTPATTYDDQGLEQGTTYFYTVTAIDPSDGTRSSPSATAQATTFATAFSATLTANRNEQGSCIVQRIEPSRLFRGGTLVVLTVAASTNTNLVIDRIYISQAASGGDPYDPGPDLTEVASAVFVPQGTLLTLPPVTYPLVEGQPLLIAFDIGMPGGVRLVPNNVPPSEAVAFVLPGQQAALADRQAGIPPVDRIYLVATIDVA
jgi:hypothetical protein